jgi:hypothetical protein
MAALVPPHQFWRWKDTWSNSLRTAVYSAALVEFLSSGSLITLSQTSEVLGSELLFLDTCIMKLVHPLFHSPLSF